MKRLLSLFLVLSMLSAEFLPVAAMASDTADPTSETVLEETVPTTEEESVPPTSQETSPPVSEETVPHTTAGTVPAATEESVPETTAETIPVVTEETVPETTEETVPETTEETIPETTEETIPETTEEILEDPSGLSPEEIQAIFTRNDGTWLFPLDRSFYESISSWCGSRNGDLCLVCGMVHTAADMALTANGNFGMEFEIPAGTPVYAPAPGYVYYSTCSQFGDLLILEHETRTEYSYYSVFANLNSRDVQDQSIADAGQLLGTSRDTLRFYVFRDYAGLGEDIAADPYTSLLQAQQRGWVGSGRERGMICNNPSPYSEDLRPVMEDHPGTVTYTFLKDEVTIQLPQEPAETTPPEQQQDGAGSDADDKDYPSYQGLRYGYNDNNTVTIVGKDPTLTGVIRIPETIEGKKVVGIFRYAFESCKDITEVVFPPTLEGLGIGSFMGCTNLKKINYPVGLKGGGTNCFAGCPIKEIVIPEGITTIVNNALDGMGELQKVTFPSTLKHIGREAFQNCGKITELNFPAGLETIGYCTFAGCAGLTKVHLPDTVTNLGMYAFAGCKNLSSINYPKSLKSGGTNCFADCPKLTSIVIPEGVTSIASYTFEGCGSLRKITFPSTLQTIDAQAFAGCSGLTNLVLPEGLKHIGYCTFQNCTGLTTVALPDTVESLNKYTFADCKNLERINFPLNWKTGGTNCFAGCPKLTEITVPEGVTTIPDCAFDGCGSLQKITFPSTLMAVGASAFQNCGALKELNFNDGLMNIGYCSFKGCVSITQVHLPNSFLNMGMYAFADCVNLSDINFPLSFKSGGTNAFANCPNLTEIVVPEGVVRIPNNAFAGCGSLTKITLPKGLKIIDREAFANCTALKNIEFPSTLESINYCAFDGCAIESLKFPKGFKHLNMYAFRVCRHLKSVIFPTSLEACGEAVFAGCDNLAYVVFPEGIGKIPKSVLRSMKGLDRIYIGGTLTEICDYAFNDTNCLKNIYYAGSAQDWHTVIIRQGNDPVHTATIHYNWDGTTTEDGEDLKNFSVIVMENKKPGNQEKEAFTFSEDARVQGYNRDTGLSFNEWTDSNGQVTVHQPEETGLTISKKGYVTRTISLDRLRLSNKVYLQPVALDYPIISALWVNDRDILHEEFMVHPGREDFYELEAEIDWGGLGKKSLKLYQEGKEVNLNYGTSRVQLSRLLDLNKPIFLVATNAKGNTSKKVFSIKSNQVTALDGFSFRLGDSMTFTLPNWLPPFLAGKKIGTGLYSNVPVEVSLKDGKAIFAFGINLDASMSDSGKGMKDPEIKLFSKNLKKIRASKKNWDNPKALIKDAKASLKHSTIGFDGGYSLMGFAEGYIGSDGKFKLQDSYIILVLDGSVTFHFPFSPGGVPIFVEVTLGREFSVQAEAFLNMKIKEFTPDLILDYTNFISGGVGIGFPKYASCSGGVTGKNIDTIHLDQGKLTYFRKKGVLDWYVKLNVLCFKYSLGGNIGEKIWIEYPDPGKAAAYTETACQDSYFNAALYKKEDLSYQANGSAFMGISMAEASTFSAAEETNNAAFVSNAYSNAAPQTVTFKNGKRLAVWVGSMNGGTDADSMNLWYSFYDGAWSQPKQVDADGTMDGCFAMKAFDNTAVIAYQDASQKVGGISSLNGIAPYMGMSVGIFDSNAETFATQSISTGNLCTLPAVSKNGSEYFAVWVCNGGNDWFGTQGGNAVCSSMYRNGQWTTPNVRFTVPHPILDLASWGDRDVLYTADTDGNLDTSEDLEMFRNGNRITKNDHRDSGAAFVDGRPMWNADGILVIDGNPCMEEGARIGSDRYQVVNQNGLKALVYAEEDGLASVLYAAFASPTGWGTPMEIYRAGTSIPNFSAGVTPGGGLSILIQSQAVVGDFTSQDPYGSSCLTWFNAPPLTCNLKLEDVYFADKDYYTGHQMPIHLTIKNTAQLAVDQIHVQLKEEDGTVAAEAHPVVKLQSGASKDLVIHYLVPDAKQGRVLTASITAENMEETIKSDNTMQFTLSYDDVSVDNVRWGKTNGGQTVIHADIINGGSNVQNNIKVELREGSVDGKVLQTRIIPSIDPQNLWHVAFATTPRYNTLYYVCVAPQAGNKNTGNDYDFVYAKNSFQVVAANMTLGSTLTMHFYFNQADLKPTEQYYAQITKLNPDGTDNMSIKIPQKDFKKFGSNLYQISFPHLAAKEMANDLRVQIFYADGTPASEPRIDGIRAYSMRIFKSQPKMVRTMLLDMLNYGAEAQRFFKYNQEDPANNQFSDRDQWDATRDVRISDHRVKGKNYAGSTLKLESRLMMDLYFTNVTADQYAVLSYVDHTGRTHEKKVPYSQMKPNGSYRIVTVDDMVIADCRQLITCKLYNGKSQEVGSVVDSPESYCARMQGKGGIYMAIMKFSTSAHYYLHNR